MFNLNKEEKRGIGLTDENTVEIIMTNVLLILFWHFMMFCACKLLGQDFFDYNKYTYAIKYWEDNGKWYSKRLKIKLWKDKLPQYVSRNGFSKKSFSSLNLEYIDNFIQETCRAEWVHKRCAWSIVPVFLLNNFAIGTVLSGLLLLIHLPFICIQRYNRIRLLRVREKVLKLKKSALNSEKIIKFVKNLEAVDS